MILGSLLVGIITAVFSAVTTLLLGHGLLIALGTYVVGGMVGMSLMLALTVLRRPRALLSMMAVEG